MVGFYFERWRKAKGDVDTYKFQALCRGGPNGSLAGETEGKVDANYNLLCPSGAVYGMVITRYRGGRDSDPYTFQLVCK
jgi:hypothetical protein